MPTMLRCALLLLLGLVLLPVPAQAQRPTLPDLSGKESERLEEGKLVLTTDRSGGEGKALVTGVIMIRAEPAKIWSVVLSNEHIKTSSKSIKEVTTYKDVVGEDGVRDLRLAYLLKVGWTEIRYHSARRYHAAADYMTWVLDTTRDNDIEWTEGSYSTWPGSSPGSTVFLYKARIETGKGIPQWLEEDLTESSLKKYLVYVKKIAEE
ncbi:MAG: hypothetical protein VX498_01095 [Myxococcota bacterium]|nr:hypothetical protein [Myxococcota bacterium]